MLLTDTVASPAMVIAIVTSSGITWAITRYHEKCREHQMRNIRARMEELFDEYVANQQTILEMEPWFLREYEEGPISL